MDTLTKQLLPASFRDVPFHIHDEVLPEEGRKIILHEYVNSDKRFVEDQGQLPSKFKLTAFVHGTDFKEKTQALRKALNEKGPGKLVLPVFGSIDAYALKYDVTASQTAIGEVVFNLEFAVGRPAPGPVASNVTEQEVYDLGDQARETLEESLSDVWNIPATSANSSVSAYDMIQAISQSINSFRNLVSGDILSQLLNILTHASFSLASLVRSNRRVSNTLIGSTADSPGVWQLLSIGSSQAGGGFQEAESLFSYGSNLSTSLLEIQSGYDVLAPIPGYDIPVWPETTAERIQRNRNRSTVVFTVRTNALVTALESAAGQDYTTLDSINDTRDSLESAYEVIMRDETIDVTHIQSLDVIRVAVERVRLACLDVLEQKRQQVFDTTQIEQAFPTSAFVASFRLYAEEFTDDIALGERAIELRDLNPAQRAVTMVGDLNVFRN